LVHCKSLGQSTCSRIVAPPQPNQGQFGPCGQVGWIGFPLLGRLGEFWPFAEIISLGKLGSRLAQILDVGLFELSLSAAQSDRKRLIVRQIVTIRGQQIANSLLTIYVNAP